MADRTAAGAYGMMMTALSKLPRDQKKVADMFWFTKESLENHDFSPSQANADDALLKLGLIERGEYSPDNQMRSVSVRSAIQEVAKVFKRDMRDGDSTGEPNLLRLAALAKPFDVRVTVPRTGSTYAKTEVMPLMDTATTRVMTRAPSRSRQAPAAAAIPPTVGGAVGGVVIGGLIGGGPGALIGGGLGFLAGLYAEHQ